MPAKCSRCGYEFAPNAIRVAEGVRDFTVSNVTVNCPRCGALDARMLEGQLNVRDGAFEMVSGPQWSWDLIDSLRGGLREIVEEQPQDPIRALAKVNPEVAEDVQAATQGMSRKAKLAVLSALLTLLATDYATVEHNLEAVARFLGYVFTHGAPPTVM